MIKGALFAVLLALLGHDSFAMMKEGGIDWWHSTFNKDIWHLLNASYEPRLVGDVQGGVRKDIPIFQTISHEQHFSLSDHGFNIASREDYFGSIRVVSRTKGGTLFHGSNGLKRQAAVILIRNTGICVYDATKGWSSASIYKFETESKLDNRSAATDQLGFVIHVTLFVIGEVNIGPEFVFGGFSGCFNGDFSSTGSPSVELQAINECDSAKHAKNQLKLREPDSFISRIGHTLLRDKIFYFTLCAYLLTPVGSLGLFWLFEDADPKRRKIGAVIASIVLPLAFGLAWFGLFG